MRRWTRILLSSLSPLGTLPPAAHCRDTHASLRVYWRILFMIDTVVVAPGESSASVQAGVSWPAIVAGAVVACALTLVLLAFGTGLGLSVVSPWAGSGVSATTFKIGTGLYLIVIAMISSSIGGFIARRFRGGGGGGHKDVGDFCGPAPRVLPAGFAPALG